MSGYTIEGVIRRENNHAISKEEVRELMSIYNVENGTKVPTVGTSVKVPVLIPE